MSIPTSSIFSDTESKMPYLLVQDTTHNPPLPLPIKLGDINQDGFPDLLAIVASGTGPSADRTPRIAYSVPCSKGMAGCSSDGKGRRGFEVLSKGGDAFKSVKDARGVAFLDMDEDVSVPLVLVSMNRATLTKLETRVHWTSWCNAQTHKAKETWCLCKTTFTMMPSS